MSLDRVPSSFRDPSGFVFREEGLLYRTVNGCYQESYRFLMDSGLYDVLIKEHLFIPHKEVERSFFEESESIAILQPEVVPFISYPYEWSFSQLKDAALLTLQIQKYAIEYGMTLKDASAYNIQFKNGKPIFIDTLSFDRYQKGEPWKAYKQFCQHFLAPLALMSYCDVRLNQLFRTFIDGVPLDLVSSLLPLKTWCKPSLLLHVHLHAKAQKRYEDSEIKKDKKKAMSSNAFSGLIDSLEGGIEKLRWKAAGTEWVDYYNDDSYTTKGFEHKKRVVSEFLKLAEPKIVWDLGANDGVFSRIASQQKSYVISWDIDLACVDNNYQMVKKNKEQNVLPLMLDLTNPSNGVGWGGIERDGLKERGPADCIMALALIHHLAISNNVPIALVAEYLSKLCTWLIIEFVPKSDKKIQKLLATREDVFDNYTQEKFEQEFCIFFTICAYAKINDSERIIYLMRKK